MNIATSTKPRVALRTFKVTIPNGGGSSVAERVTIRVPMMWHEELGEWVLTEKAEELIETTKARYMGLLLPQQLRALRQRHGLSQQSIGDLLRIGAKSWTRWETGKQRPSQSINLLLCALEHGLITPQQLAELRAPPTDWSAQFRANAQASQTTQPVVIDFCRARRALDEERVIKPLEVAL